jgi:hypothetical protein
MNNEQHEIYISMNTLHEKAHGRCKSDVAEIRHIYLDFDHNGPEAIRKLSSRKEVPPPNHLIESSPGRYQVIWRVTGFEKPGAEMLMRGMVQEFGADVAATDCARVLRLPGFYNQKRERPHLVPVENLSSDVYRPNQFPEYSEEAVRSLTSVRRSRTTYDSRDGSTGLSQSERDWAYVKRALAPGDKPSSVIRAIAFGSHIHDNPSQTTVRVAVLEQRRYKGLKT